MSEINSVVSSIDTGTNIKFTGKSDSEGNNLRVEDGKLSGTIVGSVIKDYTGRVDDVTLELSNVPFDGVGGSSGYEKKETDVYLVPEQTFEVVNSAAEGDEPYYNVLVPVKMDVDSFNSFHEESVAICILDGKEYRAVKHSRWASYIQYYFSIRTDANEEFMRLFTSGTFEFVNPLTEEDAGTHTISIHYTRADITPSEDFKAAVASISDVQLVGILDMRMYTESEEAVVPKKLAPKGTVDILLAPSSSSDPLISEHIISESGKLLDERCFALFMNFNTRFISTDYDADIVSMSSDSTYYGESSFAVTVANCGTTDLDLSQITNQYGAKVAVFKYNGNKY